MPSLPRLCSCLSLIVAVLAWAPGWCQAQDVPPDQLQFEAHIRPLFERHCFACHAGKNPQAGLDLQTRGGVLRGGQSGPAVRLGSAQASLLYARVVADEMPAEGEKLTPEEKGLLRAWMDHGAKGEGAAEQPTLAEVDGYVIAADENYWALQPLARRSVPALPAGATQPICHPIDAFLWQKLAARGLTFSPEADKLTLLRRAKFDLLGLPPTPADAAAFLADDSPDAYERLIDRLLASPHYGERWGRHWLDAAGYADSEGILDADYVRAASWRYRDYVIAAFNADKPYDRFLQEQIAGDELADFWTAFEQQPQLPPEVQEAIVATGFLRCASDTSRPDFANIKNAPGYYYQTLDDTLRIVASVTLGLTVQCARCHSHKYDPLAQSDYYRLQAIFMGGYRPAQWVPQVERRQLLASQAELNALAAHNAQVDAAVAVVREKIVSQLTEYANKLYEARLAALPEAIRADVAAAIAAPADQRTEVQKYLAEKLQPHLRPEGEALNLALRETYPEVAALADQLAAEAAAAESPRLPPADEVRAFYDLPGEPVTPILLRGDYRTPGPEVQPGVPAAIVAPEPFVWSAPAAGAKSSGRRLALARWLTQPGHPLTSRVLVNRVWMHHFGEGIVSTPEDFGATGAQPSHPELLDWLAVEFVAGGWRLKSLHRLLMTSAAYRQRSTRDAAQHAVAAAADPENRLLWRQRLRRLEAEPLRDAVLFAAGRLDGKLFGPPGNIARQADGEVTVAVGPEQHWRSIYLQVRRSQPVSLLQAFDQPVMETNCVRRGQSTVSLQALTLLNSSFMIDHAAALADRARQESSQDPLARALQLAWGRPPTPRERELLSAFLADQAARHAAPLTAAGQPLAEEQQLQVGRLALADLCHMLLSANEFAYVD